jgi:predicted exporter
MAPLERLTAALVRRPRAVLAVAGAVTAIAVFFLFRLKIDTDVNSLVRKDDPWLQLTTRLQGDFPLRRTLLVVLRADRPETLEAALPEIVRELRASPHLQRVVATREEAAGPRIDWFRRAPLYAFPPETIDRLTARLTGPERRAELEAGKRRLAEDPLAGKETLLRDPLGRRWIFDEAMDRMADRFPFRLRAGSPFLLIDSPPLAFIRCAGKQDSPDIAFSKSLLDDVNARLAPAQKNGQIRVELAGGYVTAMSISTIMRHDLQLQFISSMVGVLLYLWLFTRSFLTPHLVFIPVVLAIVWGLGFGTAVLGPLTPLAMSMAAIVAGLGTDYPIYLFSRFRAERLALGRDEAIVRSQTSLGRAFIGSATTTMGGFLVLVFSQFPGLRQFGVLTFLGFTLSVVAAIVLVPVLLLGVERWVRPAGAEPVPLVARAAKAVWASRARRPVALALLFLGLLSWGGIALGRVPLDLDLRNTMAPGDPGQKVLERLEGDLGMSVYPVFALVESGDRRDAVARLKSAGVIAHADGPHELVPSAAQVARVERFHRETAGWKDATLADLAALGFKPDPFRKSLGDFEALLDAPPPSIRNLDLPEFEALRKTMRVENSWVVYLWPKCSPWLPADRAAFDARVVAEFRQVGLYSAYHAPDRQAGSVQKDLRVVGGLSVAAIVLLTILSLGSLRDGFLALLPVFVATGITLVACTFFGGTIKSMNLAAIPIILGIGVDGGIHYVARLRARGGDDPASALGDIGPGYWGATFTTIIGFGSIAFSSTPGLSFMGVLVIVGMLASTLATLFMLPALASWKSPDVPGPQNV